MSTVQLLANLEDSFDLIPMNMALSSLGDALMRSEEEFCDAMTFSPPARRYWSVECEMLFEKKGILIGNAFVIAQVLITQAVSIINKIDILIPTIKIEKVKQKLINNNSQMIQNTNISEIAFIDAIANYFKHHFEWPDNWDCNSSNSHQKKTIKILSDVGLAPSEMTVNMGKSLEYLKIENYDLFKLCSIIENWRESLAKNIRDIKNS
jgi:hypothetical protein